ncbi:hypothetical protein GW7_09462 [Heterocephalus glaber]|uniref:Uncharacterized protein n=1 Tax=Heterocephalus glaber TaxID=10181 RepID=G5BZ95_HETGA|nr:hypothetical protein GW7_09462 [Heterocephalus glaber]
MWGRVQGPLRGHPGGDDTYAGFHLLKSRKPCERGQLHPPIPEIVLQTRQGSEGRSWKPLGARNAIPPHLPSRRPPAPQPREEAAPGPAQVTSVSRPAFSSGKPGHFPRPLPISGSPTSRLLTPEGNSRKRLPAPPWRQAQRPPGERSPPAEPRLLADGRGMQISGGVQREGPRDQEVRVELVLKTAKKKKWAAKADEVRLGVNEERERAERLGVRIVTAR